MTRVAGRMDHGHGDPRDLRIRDFIEGDAIELRRVFMSSIHTIARGFYTGEQLQAWAPAVHDEEAWARKMAAMRPFVAVVRDQVAGYADLQPAGHIDHFFVAGGFAGQGVGTALMRHLLEVAAARGLSRLTADVSLSAEAFFARHGFVVDARQTVEARGVALANARMSKVLDG